jgi:uncharacterized membrane protein YqjE
VTTPTSPGGADVPPVLPSIPLAPEPAKAEQSIGDLVRDVSTHLSSLVRAEVELAKSEVTGEVRKGLTGSAFFAVAAAIGLFSLFFLFFAFAELLSEYFLRWVAFAIVFGVMVLAAVIFGLLGYRKVRKIRKPERTIDSLRESAQLLQQRARPDAGRPELDGPSGVTAR